MLHDELPDRVVHQQHFNDTASAYESNSAAEFTALGAIEGHFPGWRKTRQTKLVDKFDRWLIRLATRRAEISHQALGLDAHDRGGQEIVFDPHVEQPVDGTRGIVGMKRRQHHVSGECGLHGDLGGLQVADFSDHDDVRILPHDRSQGVGEGQPDLGLDLDLIDPFHLVFDWIFNRQNLEVGLVQRLQRGVERRRLAAARRPGHEKNAVRLLQGLLECAQRRCVEPESFEVEQGR
ncbi:hypothetical protein GALL_406830 [mine drainage metagenome]|uniref:Uncharacterized protein n=1 Tax=mine drainage metagenome TaxID=410659 RepID=A0A1J5Q1L8_9ZZZZ